MISRVRKFLRLDRDERRLVMAALFRVAVSSAVVRVCSPRRLARFFSTRTKSLPNAAAPAPERIVWAIDACSTAIPGATCLVKSLAACSLLRSYGHAASVQIGVRKSGGAFEAHAWVESGGRVFLDDGASAYEPLSTTPRAVS